MKDTNPLLVRLAPPSDRGRVSPGNSATFTSAWLAEKPSESSATMTLTSGAEQTPKVSAEILKNVLNSAN